MNAFHDEDEPEDDDEDASFDDGGDDDPTMPCPYCGAAIYDDAIRCPVCDRYLSDEERVKTNQPLWVVITALVLLAVIFWAWRR